MSGTETRRAGLLKNNLCPRDEVIEDKATVLIPILSYQGSNSGYLLQWRLCKTRYKSGGEFTNCIVDDMYYLIIISCSEVRGGWTNRFKDCIDLSSWFESQNLLPPPNSTILIFCTFFPLHKSFPRLSVIMQAKKKVCMNWICTFIVEIDQRLTEVTMLWIDSTTPNSLFKSSKTCSLSTEC